MRVYKHDQASDDCRLPHRQGDDLPVNSLHELGVLYYTYPVHDTASQDEVDHLAKARNYQHRDEITVSPAAMGAVYEEKIEIFFHEHIHEDEEIRYILDGKGYFDVRSKDSDWLRIEIEPGDLIILPSGIYHRFTVDTDNYIKAMRLFQTNPKWTAINRGSDADSNDFRKTYLEKLSVGVF